MAAQKTATLNNGAVMPVVGLGCWIGTQGVVGQNEATRKMVEDALKVGYRHFDTASYYGNEEAVGEAIRASTVPRSEVFVTTKLAGPDHGNVADGFAKSLANLDVGYIDLFLIHWPQAANAKGETIPFGESPTLNETWAGMEALLLGGKVRAIGVSNFSIKNLDLLLKTAKIVPAVNQVQGHPYHPNSSLHTYSKAKGIHLTAYSPLGQYDSPILRDPKIVAIANEHKKTPGQVVLSWGVQRGWSVVPKSANSERMAQNLEILNLSEGEFQTISELHKEEGKLLSLCDYGEGGKEPGYVIGWSLEAMGWEKLD